MQIWISMFEFEKTNFSREFDCNYNIKDCTVAVARQKWRGKSEIKGELKFPDSVE